MTDIDRRTLVMLAGAGLVVAGCGPSKEKKHGKPVNPGQGGKPGKDPEIETSGECDEFGHSVASPKMPAGFKARLLCVVYIRFPTTGGGPIIQQKYVELSGSESDAAIRTMVQKVLEQIKGTDHHISYYRERSDFEKFSFDRPTYVAFFVDNDEGLVRFNWDDTLGEEDNREHILRFTPFSGHKGYPREAHYKRRKANKNFYGIQIWTMPSAKNLAKAKVISVNYFNRDESEQQIKRPHPVDNRTWYLYSMNIHLQMATSSGKMVPVILDPDTGNMGSDP